MLMKHVLGACIAALLVTACGGAPTGEDVLEPASEAAAPEVTAQAWRLCNGRSISTRYFYSDSSMTTIIGRQNCGCTTGGGERYGSTSGYYEDVVFSTCR